MKNVIIEMFKKVQGGKAAIAGFLGMTEAELNNRLYQTKGQRFTEEELIAIQQEFTLTDWTDELNRRMGHVSFPIPDKDELDTVELSNLQLKELAARGILFTSIENFLEDGELSPKEVRALRKLLHNAQKAKAQVLEAMIVLHSKGE